MTPRALVDSDDSGDFGQQLPYPPQMPHASGPPDMSIYNPGPIDPATGLPFAGPVSPAYPGLQPTPSMRLPSDNLPGVPGFQGLIVQEFTLF